ncbi:MAG TPA: Ada metal-binding domain-containing protein [Roseiarcus sp.]|nr:Ada metal-binding domain-containing protein [Roseiarcus sp.]
MFRLLGSDGVIYESNQPGALGGHRKLKIYGSLDCESAKRAIAKGQYVKQRVFFADETTAIAAGYRPCQKCLPKRHAIWKADPDAWPLNASRMDW